METSDFRGGDLNRESTTSRGVSTSRGRGTNRGGATNLGATSHGDRDRDFRQYQPFSMLHVNFSGPSRGNLRGPNRRNSRGPTRSNFRGNSRRSTFAESLLERDVHHKPNGGENENSSHRGKYNESSETSQEDDTSNDESTEESDDPTESTHTGDVANDPQNAKGYAKFKLNKMQNEEKEKEGQECRRPEEEAEKSENPTSVKFEEANANDDEEYDSKETYQDNIRSLDEVPDDEDLMETVDEAVGDENNSQGEDVVSADDDRKESYQDKNEFLVEISDDKKFLKCTDDEDMGQNEVVANDDEIYYLKKGDQYNNVPLDEVFGEDVACADDDDPKEAYQDNDALLDETSDDEKFLDCNDEDKSQDEVTVSDDGKSDQDKDVSFDEVYGEDSANSSEMYDLKEAFQVNSLSLDEIHENSKFTAPIDLVQAVSGDKSAHSEDITNDFERYDFKEARDNEDVPLDEVPDDVGGENNAQGEDVTSGNEMYDSREAHQDKDVSLDDTFDDEEFLDCNDVEDKVQDKDFAEEDNWIPQEVNWGLIFNIVLVLYFLYFESC